MNSLLVAAVGLLAFWLGYRFYASSFEKLWDIDSSRKTPANEKYDGVDYIPAKHWTILFGHHFSSIAGAGPIIGPVLACAYFGWVPAVLWIVIGTIFIGAVHDYAAMVVSVRNGGKSISDIAQSVMGRKTKLIFAMFLFLALILVVAVFTATTAQTLVEEPKIVVPTFGLILIAVLVGLMIYRWKKNFVFSTSVGIILLVLALVAGEYFPVAVSNIKFWMAVLLAYCVVASVLPVNILLQPRDYLSAYLLVFGMGFGYLGLIISHPAVKTPAFTGWSSGVGPLWPMMFVFIACGAISGFHALISSGTSSKQVSNEADIKKIGYGAMATEGFLALLALLAVCAGLYWHPENAPAAGLVYPELAKTGNYIGTFACGYGQITDCIFGAKFGKFIAILILNAFVLTTLDSATRITRYISTELFGEGMNIKVFNNRYFSTMVVVMLSGMLAFGDWKKIWPIFGASNQLIGAIVLVVISVVLLAKKKTIKYTIYPAVFMLVTSVGALGYQTVLFTRKGNILLGAIGAILIMLTVFIIAEAAQAFKKYAKQK